MTDNLEKIKSIYRTALLENGDSPVSLCWPKGRQDERFAALLNPALQLAGNPLTLCDFGCGLAHMQTYLSRHEITKFDYQGFDVVPEMVTTSLELGRQVELIGHDAVLPETYDCVVASGIFNMKFFNDQKENQNYVFERISMLLSASRKYFACDFMRPDVDFMQDGAWHQPYDALVAHLTKYARDIEINMRVLPYEFTVVVYLDA